MGSSGQSSGAFAKYPYIERNLFLQSNLVEFWVHKDLYIDKRETFSKKGTLEVEERDHTYLQQKVIEETFLLDSEA